MAASSDPLCIGLVGPAQDQPCGIADYVRRLEPALADRCHLIHASYHQALNDPALDGCRALLVHYERTLVPGPDYLAALSARHPGRVFIMPHEVYAEDPFAFPYASIRSAFPPLLWLKRLRYRWRHREYAREQALQGRGYDAARVVPLSREGGDILRSRADAPDIAARILPPVPIARFDLPVGPRGPAGGALKASLFPAGPRAVVGIYGFLNPGLDYASAFDLIESLGRDTALVLLGGERAGYRVAGSLEAEAGRRGLGDRFKITGYLAESSLADHLGLCDFFLCPMRFKSSSASILQLFRLGKSILVPAGPLTTYLRDEGAPLDLYANPRELLELGRAILEGRHRRPEDRYRWDFAAVAEAYLKAVEMSVPDMPASASATLQPGKLPPGGRGGSVVE